MLLYTGQMSSLTTALRIVSSLGRERTLLRVSEVARELNLPKSTVSRLLNELVRADFIEHASGERGFRAGPELFRLGSLYRDGVPAEDQIDAVCLDLVKRHPATAYVGVLQGIDLVILRCHQGSYPLRFILEPGSKVPAYATAVGKALLARLDKQELAALLPKRLVYESRDVDTTREAMLGELQEARQRGYARLDDRVVGVGAIGVAVRISPGRTTGFAVCYAREAVAPLEQADIAAALTAAAAEIGELWGDPYWNERDRSSLGEGQ
ncbi:IclR family transcriptional regulator [Chelatococcus sp. GCM10030263]|uniref:IclR family transcriptional regulator n=1 Tax=Chelatococcus sp. GCM10030263 TaxID=3273387 RepID=UPI00361E1E0C